jgi:PAS domain S-box-containing protein
VDGAAVYSDIVASPIKDEDGNVTHMIEASRDITSLIQAQAEVSQLGYVLEESLNEILIFDAQTLRFVNVNKAVRENSGYSMEELHGMTPVDLTRDMTSESFEELVKPLREGAKEKIQFEMVGCRKDGSSFPTEVHLQLMPGDPPVFVAISNDITERKRAEDALKESESRYDQLAEQNRTVAWEVDANGLYTYCSLAFGNVLGYRPDEIVGKKHFYDLHPEEGRDAFKKAVLDVFSRKESFQGLENQVETKKGRIVWMFTTGIPLLDEQGELLGYHGSDTDITDRKQMALKLAEQLDELLRWQGVMLDRSDRSQELKREVNELSQRLDEPIRYPSQAVGGSEEP